jgi:hypothetical protein
MRYFKFFNYFIIGLLIAFNGNAQMNSTQKEAIFRIKNKPVEGVKYYLLIKDNLYLLSSQHGMICFPDTLSTKFISLLVSYNKHEFFITNYNYKEAYYLHTYFDNRLFNNDVNKKFGGYSKLKFLFKKRYLIDDGSGYVTITPWADISKFNVINPN